jgi:hypothetical protein
VFLEDNARLPEQRLRPRQGDEINRAQEHLRNTVSFSVLYIKNDHFAKTGSGQTEGNLQKDAVFRTSTLPLSGASSCEKRHAILNVTYVCPEPVLVK